MDILEITPDLLMSLQESVRIIDVRTPEEFFGPEGHIAGAKLASLGESLVAFLDDVSQDGSYVFVCAHGKRSLQAVALAREKGFSIAISLKGGLYAWKNAGFPVVFENSKGNG